MKPSGFSKAPPDGRRVIVAFLPFRCLLGKVGVLELQVEEIVYCRTSTTSIVLMSNCLYMHTYLIVVGNST